MMKPIRLTIAQTVCRHLPPIMSQKVRSVIYPLAPAMKDNYELMVRAQTGSTFKARTGDFHGYPFSVHGYYDWRNTAIALALATEGDTIVEIGANIGTETIGFSDIVGASGKVYAFEPLPSNLNALHQLTEFTTHQNTVIYPFALSDKTRTASFVVPPEHASGIGHVVQANKSISDQTVTVNCVTLDSLLESIGTAKLIFMDTEGEDVRILRGARTFIKRFEPLIVLEASPKLLGRAGFSLSDLHTEIRDLSYSPYVVNRFRLSKIETLDLNRSDNWLCVPKHQHLLIRRVQKYLLMCAFMPCIRGLNPLSRI